MVVSIPWLSSPQHLLQPPLHANLAGSLTEDAVSLQLLLYWHSAYRVNKPAGTVCQRACPLLTNCTFPLPPSFTSLLPLFLIILIMESAASSWNGLLSSLSCQRPLRATQFPPGCEGVMLRQGESGRGSNPVIKICQINALSLIWCSHTSAQKVRRECACVTTTRGKVWYPVHNPSYSL